MTLTQLHYFITIAKTKSFNQAAQQLFVSQPSLTNSMKDLEQELDLILFYRSGRGVTLTNDGIEFLSYAKQVYEQYENMMERYGANGTYKKKFGVSTQHYSFAVKAFVDMAKHYDMSEYELAIRETRTNEIIHDVSTMRSEIGILYLSDFNRTQMLKRLSQASLEFHSLIYCQPYVYLWKNHPLANLPSINFKQLENYPCLSFEQGDDTSFYLAEEILSTKNYLQLIKANDRATMLNLMKGLNGYTLCSGIICEELNGDEYIAVPFIDESEKESGTMEIGYITRKNTLLSHLGQDYIECVKNYLRIKD